MTSFTGDGTLVCPLNDVSQCQGDSITSSGTVSGKDLTIMISIPGSSATDSVTMVGSFLNGTDFSGTYTDSFGDSGTWTGRKSVHPFNPAPNVIDYTGTFNSTSNPLVIPPTISVELGRDAASSSAFILVGKATVTNSPCISSLTFSGQAVGDAVRLTDATKKLQITAVPRADPSFFRYDFIYHFDAAAAACAGDSGRGEIKSALGIWDY